jgi:hypothetical protein
MRILQSLLRRMTAEEAAVGAVVASEGAAGVLAVEAACRRAAGVATTREAAAISRAVVTTAREAAGTIPAVAIATRVVPRRIL